MRCRMKIPLPLFNLPLPFSLSDISFKDISVNIETDVKAGSNNGFAMP